MVSRIETKVGIRDKTAGMTIRRMLRQWLSAEEYDEIDTPDWKTGLARIKEAKEDYFTGKECLFDHLWYGWHSFLPCPARYVALLREPTSIFSSKDEPEDGGWGFLRSWGSFLVFWF